MLKPPPGIASHKRGNCYVAGLEIQRVNTAPPVFKYRVRKDPQDICIIKQSSGEMSPASKDLGLRTEDRSAVNSKK
jgi:hypothetical protein